MKAADRDNNYPSGAQKEPLLRPKEMDVEEDEPLEEDSAGTDAEIVAESPPERELSGLELELMNAPRRRQRFILQNALKIRNIETEGRPRKQVKLHPMSFCITLMLSSHSDRCPFLLQCRGLP